MNPMHQLIEWTALAEVPFEIIREYRTMIPWGRTEQEMVDWIVDALNLATYGDVVALVNRLRAESASRAATWGGHAKDVVRGVNKNDTSGVSPAVGMPAGTHPSPITLIIAASARNYTLPSPTTGQFRCQYCGLEVATKRNLTRHERSHASRYNCPWCMDPERPSSYSRWDNMRTHIKKAHPQVDLASEEVRRVKTCLYSG